MDRALEPLVERVREMGAEGIDELLRRVRPMIYRWAVVQTADADDAEDITQKVLLQVNARIGDFEGRARFTTWLYRVTANAVGEQRRSRGIWRRFLEKLRVAGIADRTQIDVLAGIDNARSRDRVAALLHDLTRTQRVLTDLVDLQGYAPAEAAEMLAMNPNTARVHLMRARRILRRRLLSEEE